MTTAITHRVVVPPTLFGGETMITFINGIRYDFVLPDDAQPGDVYGVSFTTLRVRIPVNVHPGDKFWANVDGVMMILVAPSNAEPGRDSLIHVAALAQQHKDTFQRENSKDFHDEEQPKSSSVIKDLQAKQEEIPTTGAMTPILLDFPTKCVLWDAAVQFINHDDAANVSGWRAILMCFVGIPLALVFLMAFLISLFVLVTAYFVAMLLTPIISCGNHQATIMVRAYYDFFFDSIMFLLPKGIQCLICTESPKIPPLNLQAMHTSSMIDLINVAKLPEIEIVQLSFDEAKKMGKRIFFVSHKWYPEGFDNKKGNLMTFVNALNSSDELFYAKYVWLDYFCAKNDLSSIIQAIRLLPYMTTRVHYGPGKKQYMNSAWCSLERFVRNDAVSIRKLGTNIYNKQDWWLILATVLDIYGRDSDLLMLRYSDIRRFLALVTKQMEIDLKEDIAAIKTKAETTHDVHAAQDDQV